MITRTQVELALSHVSDPDEGQNIVQMGMVDNIEVEGLNVSFMLALTTEQWEEKDQIKEACLEAVHRYVDRRAEVHIDFSTRVDQPAPTAETQPLKHNDDNETRVFDNIKNVILVASGKGGVGKSTVAVNLAVSLAKTGARVGLVDADVYGPSVPIMFSLQHQDIYGEEHEGKTYMMPIEKYGIKVMSVGLMVEPEKALVWRGPMASSALKQILNDTWWGEIDYLVVDMPPGTGDVQLTIAQSIPVTGAIIVSTPQQVALADVVRGVEMFRNPGINIPVLGFVENMAYFTPAELPENKYYIFGKGGCRQLAEQMNIALLGEIPLVQSIAESGDNGKPISLWSDRPTAESDAFMTLAENTIEAINRLGAK